MSQKMRGNPKPKFVTFSLKTLSAAVVSAVLFSNAYGAGLGKLTVLSSLGQPLHAEIELTSISKEEAGSLSVKLASVEAFRQANIEFNPALFALRFAIEQRNGRQFVRVTSNQPINEPFVDMLLELGGGNSRLVREYTFLLDPPELRRTQPAQITAPSAPVRTPQTVARAESVPQPAATERPTGSGTVQAPSQRAANTVQGSVSVPPSEGYLVKEGDTLVKIAGQYKPESISLDQMLIALQRANPDAFIANNINRLRAGQILSVPDAQAASGIAPSEAKKLVLAQSADFSSYRNKLADRVLQSTPQKSDEAKQSSTGKITAKVEEQPTAVSEAKDKLKLSKAGVGSPGGEKGGISTADAEDRIAKGKALKEANSRIKELETNLANLQKLLEIKNKDLAERQKQLDAAKANAPSPGAPAQNNVAAVPSTAASPAPGATQDKPTASTPVPVPAASPSSAAAQPSPSAPPAVSASNPADQPAPAVPTPSTESATAPKVEPTSSTTGTGEAKPPVKAPESQAATETKPAVVPVAAPAEETSLMDGLAENPLILGGLAALLAGLGALGIISGRRKKQQKEFNDTNLLTDSGNLTANSLFGSTGGQSVDTNNSVFNSNFAPSASQLDTNEVDPVAEADVYIAYGRDAQAEEILKEALRTQPERNAVRVKLLEIYANRKDLRAFEMLATELYSITKGEGEEWEQAAGLGIEIDPQNPLYAGGKPHDSVFADSAAFATPAQPLDELNLDALLNTTQGSKASLETLDTVEARSSYFDNTEGETAPALPDLDLKTPHAAAEIHEPAAQRQAPTAQTPPPAPSPEPAADSSLDFDFDMPGLRGEVSGPAKSESVTNVSEPEPEPAQVSSADNGLDFDFNLDSFTAKTASTPEPKIAIEENNDTEADDFAPLDFNTEHTESKKAESTAASAAASQDFDLSGISLDLTPEESTVAASEPANHMDHDANVNEMATKLDLAIAYQEIGDKDGARELLDEVVKGGNSEQTERARSILQKIA